MAASLSQLRGGRANAEWLVHTVRELGVDVRVTSVLRSRAKQEYLWNLRQAGKWPYPVAAPGTSAHEYGLAWDSWVPEPYMPWWVAVRRWAGWDVPLPDTDPVHAQIPNWREYVTSA